MQYRFGSLSFWACPSIWPSFAEIGEMACITPAWSSGGHALKVPINVKIRTSLPRIEVSRNVDSGTRDLGRDLPDVKTSGNFASELSP